MKLKFFKYLSLIFLSLGHLIGYSQYNNVWAFGDAAGLDFSTTPPTAIQTSINTSEGSASICDINGDLLFYTDGTSVWDKTHNLMPNGSNLIGGNGNTTITGSTTQGTLIVPSPANNNQYYIFSLGCRECESDAGNLYYSVVDMKLNNGLGDVLPTRKRIFMDSLLSEHLTGVMKDYCNIWVLTISRFHNSLQAWLIDENGITNTPVTTPLIPGGGTYEGELGSIIASPDGTKLAISRGNLVLYEFNWSAGTVSNPLVLIENPASDRYYSCFSNDNSKLYSTGRDTLFQFDLSLNSAAQIINSIFPVATVGFASMKSGSDGKIYLPNVYSDSLHSISQPSLSGQSCQFIRNGIALLPNTRSLLGLPNATVFPLKPLNFQTTVTDTTICTADSFILSAKILNGSYYKWNDGQRGTYNKSNSSGTYWVRYSIPDLSNCSSIIVVDTYHVFQAPRWLKIFTEDTVICEGSSVTIDAVGSPDYSYSWHPSIGVNDTTILNPDITPDTTTLYTLTANYPGCPDTSLTILIEIQSVEVDLGIDKKVCYGEMVPLESVVSPYRSDYSYAWTPTDGLQHNQSANNAFIADSNVVYYLEVTTPMGCKGTDSIQIEVYPPDFASASSDTGFCPPSGGVPLWATGGDEIYQWFPDYGLDDANSATPWANPATPTLYKVIVTNDAGCIDSLKVFVDVYPNAVITMPDTIRIYPGEHYHLLPGTNCHYFNWFPTNGINSVTAADPVFYPEVRTRYFVTGRTEQGCVVKDSIDVLVEGSVIDMPNAFVPGKGVVPVLKPAKRGIAELIEFSIYNRWGNKVFETTDIEAGWDGMYNGQPQPVGVYVYQIEAITDSGQRFRENGDVTLIR